MPFIKIQSNRSITKEEEVKIKSELGRAVTLIGKSEAWLMIRLEGNCSMYFKGSDEPCAISEVMLYGSADNRAYDALTSKITEILSDTLSVSPSRIYIKYDEISTWGYSGSNF